MRNGVRTLLRTHDQLAEQGLSLGREEAGRQHTGVPRCAGLHAWRSPASLLPRSARTALERDARGADGAPTVSPSAEYSLSELGRGLLVPLSAVADWADQHGSEIDARAGSAGLISQTD
ncbi:hypothetical protein F1721_31810 [Saccharopolyspora hirsuta]|uniref:Helix-turn-helix transcriptional regulator n=1 Tax=Saccharopolyspora hirsuta TaxID=1837 RepID=A0A5M7B9H7_SACHI|nr:hypothetical protein F1721_31810 [Saccharopolyspora hirsuta]